MVFNFPPSIRLRPVDRRLTQICCACNYSCFLMNIDLMESYLQNVGDWVIDEDKIVTYKWLNKMLGLHINTAKQLLFTYLSEQKKKSPCKVTATHLLAGELKDGSKGVLIVNEEDLVAARNRFKEITSEHVYSIQKTQYIKNLQLLYAANKLIKDAEGYITPPIKYSKSILRSESSCTLEDVKEKFANSDVSGKSSDFQKAKENKLEEGKGTNKKSSSPKRENGNLGKESTKTKAHAGKKSISTGKDRNIANFFNSERAGKSSRSPTDPTKKKDDETEPFKKMKLINDSNPVETSKADSQKNKMETIPARSKVRPMKQKKDGKKEEDEGKKRKRIKVFSDSEESNDEPLEENMSSPAKSDKNLPETEIESKMESVELEDESTPQNKRKKRKIIDKIVVHDDGFIETKKEVIYETESENEEEMKIIEAKEVVPNQCSPTKKKAKTMDENLKTKPASSVSAQQKKQSSLLSFFKKN